MADINLNVIAGTTSSPVPVSAGLSYTVTPASGGTALVEFTRGSSVDIANGVASWTAVQDGVALTGIVKEVGFMRFTAYSQAASVRITSAARSVGELALSVASSGTATASNTVVLFGSSTMRRNTDSGGYRGKGPFIQLNVRSGWPFEIVANHGVEGDTLSMMIGRINDVLAENAAWVACELGFNDINDTTPTSIEDMKSLTADLLSRLEAGGKKIMVFTMHPSDWLDTAVEQAKASEYLEYVRKLCFARGWKHYDQNSVLIDQSDGTIKAGLTTDGHHFNGAGAGAVGDALDEQFEEDFAEQWPMLDQRDLNNYFPNPTMQGNNASGTVGSGTTIATLTGTAPDGVAVTVSNATGTAVSQARADGRSGNVMRLSATNSAANGFVAATWTVRIGGTWLANTAYSRTFYRLPTVQNGFMYRVMTNGTTGATEPTWPTQIGETVNDGTVVWRCYRQLRAGDRIQAELELVECELTSGSANPYLLIECQNSGGTLLLSRYCNYINSGESGEAYPTTVDARGFMKTPIFSIPATTDRLVVKVIMQGSNGAQYRLGVGHIGIRLVNP